MAALEQVLLSAPIGKTSKRCYISNLKILQRYFPDKSMEDILAAPDSTIAVICDKYKNPQTRKAHAAAIKALFKYTPELQCKYPAQHAKWSMFHTTQDRVIATRVMNAEFSDREKTNWVPWDEVLRKEHHLSQTEYGSMRHLLLSMYTHIEPLRQDFGNVQILLTMPKSVSNLTCNGVVVPSKGPGTLILSKYKTQNSYGVYRRDLPESLTEIIRKSLEDTPRGYLFIDIHGKPYTSSNSFTKYSNKILRDLFAKRFTVSMIRHSFISNIDFNSSTPMQLIQTSRNMAHSMMQQQLYRRMPNAEHRQPAAHTFTANQPQPPPPPPPPLSPTPAPSRPALPAPRTITTTGRTSTGSRPTNQAGQRYVTISI